MRRIAATALAAVLACGLAACTGDSGVGSSASPSDSASADTTPLTDPATFINAPGHDLSDQFDQTMTSLGITLSSDTRQDRYGTWNPLTLKADAPLLSFDPSMLLVDDQSYSWDMSKVQAAWKAVAGFLVEEWVDSELVWDDSDANRATVAQRLTGSGRFFFEDGATNFPELLSGAGGLTPTILGPWAVDQDWQNWRQDGFTPQPSGDPATDAQGALYASALVPAQPAPYVEGRPRTYVTNLVPYGVSQGVDDQHFILTARMDFYRPIVVQGVDSPRYEEGSAYLSFDVSALDSGDGTLVGMLMGYDSAQLSYRNMASLAANDITRLPLLAQPTGALGANTVDNWMLTLPSDAADDTDQSCASANPTGWTGTYTTFDLPPVSSTEPGCLAIWSSTGAAATNLDDWEIYPTTTVWGIREGTILGLVSVEALPDRDAVTISALDSAGDQFHLLATLPPGTGPAWATPLVASLRLTSG
jgi:hypothetical protein